MAGSVRVQRLTWRWVVWRALQAKELQGEVLFRTTVINKQVESINKVRAQVH